MASFANCPAGPLTAGVNRTEVSVVLVNLNSGVVLYQSIPVSLLVQMYSPDTGRRYRGVGSHRPCSFTGGLIFAHSAKVLTRLYRNVPEDSVSVYLPYEWWNHIMYAAIGTMPATATVTEAEPAHPPDQQADQDHDQQRFADGPHHSRVPDKQARRWPPPGLEGRSLQQRITTAIVARKMNRGSAVTMCSRCSS